MAPLGSVFTWKGPVSPLGLCSRNPGPLSQEAVLRKNSDLGLEEQKNWLELMWGRELSLWGTCKGPGVQGATWYGAEEKGYREEWGQGGHTELPGQN